MQFDNFFKEALPQFYELLDRARDGDEPELCSDGDVKEQWDNLRRTVRQYSTRIKQVRGCSERSSWLKTHGKRLYEILQEYERVRVL